MQAAKVNVSDKIFSRSECNLPESGGVLWLYAGSNEPVEANLKQQAEQHNIDSSRLVFTEHLSPVEHQSRIRLADLSLDTFI